MKSYNDMTVISEKIDSDNKIHSIQQTGEVYTSEKKQR
ncbi:hypothetical protein SAMN05444350_1565 [Bacteroides stercorirosoris]|jgi:hypothetical protein|uniref:Uncharacterized protein n=1 Tax=Bacteroides stercorirosoris TaxID=871324 RepID=A0A1M6LVD5_9BACE|nr:hypothetical protein SAMN05444350_1565 [Bacteroides stercorirosoris]